MRSPTSAGSYCITRVFCFICRCWWRRDPKRTIPAALGHTCAGSQCGANARWPDDRVRDHPRLIGQWPWSLTTKRLPAASGSAHSSANEAWPFTRATCIPGRCKRTRAKSLVFVADWHSRCRRTAPFWVVKGWRCEATSPVGCQGPSSWRALIVPPHSLAQPLDSRAADPTFHDTLQATDCNAS